MSVHYKFKSALEYDTVTFDGLHISVGDLKAAIIQQKRIGKTSDFDLQVTNAQTKEVYVDDKTLIPKNTSLLVARIPLSQQPKKSWEGANSNLAAARKDAPVSKGVADLTRLEGSEEDKIKAMISQSTLDYDPSNYQKVRGANQRGEVPPNYCCYKCQQPGHWIKNCPLGNTDSSVDIKRSTGIPRSFMVPVDGPQAQGAMMTPTGAFAVPVVDHAAYQASELGGHESSGGTDSTGREIPDDLLCSLCHDLLTDAVMIPCCGNSFCDECIRSALLESEEHECPDCREKDISPATLIPNRFLRNSVASFRNQTGYSRRRPQLTHQERAPPPQHQPPPDNPSNGPMAMQSRPGAGAEQTQGAPPTPQAGHEDSDGSNDDNITVTVPPPHAARAHHRPRHATRHSYGHMQPRNLKPPGLETSPTSVPRLEEQQRASTPTVDERREPPPLQPTYNRPPAPYGPGPGPGPMVQGGPGPMVRPRHYNVFPPPHGGGPPAGPGLAPRPGLPPYGAPGMYPRGPYQPPPPGIKVSPKPGGGADDPLEAFERMIREKEERARRREDERRRAAALQRSRTRSPPPRSRSPRSPRSRSRADSPPPRRVSRSRSRSRVYSRSRTPRSLSRGPPPPRRRSPWSPRSPRRRPRTRSRTRERSLSLSRSRSLSPRRRRSPPHYRTPLRTPPPRSPPRRYPPNAYEGGRGSPVRGPPLYNPRYPPRNNGPPGNYAPPPLMTLKPIPPAAEGPKLDEPPPAYRARYDGAALDEPPGTQPPVPGYEPPPFEKREGPAPAERDRPPPPYRDGPPYPRPNFHEQNFREGPPVQKDLPPPAGFREGPPFRDNYKDGAPPPLFRDNLQAPPFRDGPQAQRYREAPIPTTYQDGPPVSQYRDGPPYRNAPPNVFREAMPNFRNAAQPGYRELPPHGYRDGAAHGFRDAPQPYRARPNFRDNPPDLRNTNAPMDYQEPNFRDAPNYRDGPGHVRDRPPSREGPPHLRDAAPYPRHGNFRNVRGAGPHHRNFEHERGRDHPKPDRDYKERFPGGGRDERGRDYDKKEPEKSERGRDERPRDYERGRGAGERDRDGNYEKYSPDRRRRSPVSPRRGKSREDRNKRPSENRAHSRDMDHKRDGKKDERDKIQEDKSKERDKKVKERKKKKKEKDVDKKKKKEKKEKKDKDNLKQDESHGSDTEQVKKAENAISEQKISPEASKESKETVWENDLYSGVASDGVASDGIDRDVVKTYVKTDEPKAKDHAPTGEEKESPFDGIELQVTAEELDLKSESDAQKEKDKNEVLAPMPELSKWEMEEEQAGTERTREPGEILSPLYDKSGKVTSEVLKRAENAIFAKAINAIRPIEIKKLSSDRIKLYGEGGDEEPETEEQAMNNIQITVPAKDSEMRSVEINDGRRQRYDKTPPPRLSIKERLGGKMDEPMRRSREDRVVQSTVERIKSRSKTPKRGEKEPGHRRITIDRDRSRRFLSKHDEKGHNFQYESAQRDEKKMAIERMPPGYDGQDRRVEKHDMKYAKRGGERRIVYSKEQDGSRPDVKRRSRSLSADKNRRKKVKREKEEKRPKHSAKSENKHNAVNEERNAHSRDSEKASNVADAKKALPERDRKKSTLDEANFEPDYDENVESENEEAGKKRDHSKTPLGAVADEISNKKSKLDEEENTIKLDIANVKKRASSVSGSSSGSESTSSSSSSNSDLKRRKKKKKKYKKKKTKKRVSESDSDSDGSSSDEPKKKKKKKKHKKKSSKKKKRSKHK